MLNQLDLLVAKRPDLLAIDVKYANKHVLFEHRHKQKRSHTANVGQLNHRSTAANINWLFSYVGHVNDLLRALDTARSGLSGGR